MFSDPIFIVYVVLVFLVSTCIGSFLNVVIYRLPNHMNLAFPASHCPTCSHPLKWYDNIPLFSYIFLGGKCRYCKCRITPRYFIVELLTGVVSTLIFLWYGVSLDSLIGILLFWVLIPVAFIDIEHFIIENIFIYILIGLGVASLIIGIFIPGFMNNQDPFIQIDWLSRLIGAGAVVVFTLIIWGIESLIKREILGGGDIKLMFACGLILGWQLLAFGIAIAAIISCLIECIAMLVRKTKEKKEIKDETKELSEEEEYRRQGLFPFGPYLAIGFMIAFVFGQVIIEWYIHFLLG